MQQYRQPKTVMLGTLPFKSELSSSARFTVEIGHFFFILAQSNQIKLIPTQKPVKYFFRSL